MKPIKLFSLVLSPCLFLSVLSSCRQPFVGEAIDERDVIEHTDYTSVYDMIGQYVTVDMVREDDRGLAFVEYEGKTYELGMDFLSTAMVYNTEVPSGSVP